MKIHSRTLGIKIGAKYKVYGDVMNVLYEIKYINGNLFNYIGSDGTESIGNIDKLKDYIISKFIIIQ